LYGFEELNFLPVCRRRGGKFLGKKSASYAVANTICNLECLGDELMMTQVDLQDI
jgi:hypothetical protein